jgi:hypothetical protein
MWLLRLLCVIALGVFGRCTNEGRVIRTQVFYHIYAAGDWSIVVNDQLTKIAFTGLYKTVQAINCFIVADNQTDLDKATVLLSSWGGKFIIRDSILKDPTYERFTLMKMKPLINPHDRILYIHSKGVSHHDEMAPNLLVEKLYGILPTEGIQSVHTAIRAIRHRWCELSWRSLQRKFLVG